MAYCREGNQVTLRTKGEYGNCYFGILYLFLRGKIKRIVAVSSFSPWWPWHFVCTTKHGNVLHFCPLLPHEENKFAPWWFFGCYEGISRRTIEKTLEESGRYIVLECSNITAALIIAGLFFLMVLGPWQIAWALFPFYWMAKWSYRLCRQAIQK